MSVFDCDGKELKIGDIVEGISGNGYGVTCEGWVGRITQILNGSIQDNIRVEGLQNPLDEFWVTSNRFRLSSARDSAKRLKRKIIAKCQVCGKPIFNDESFVKTNGGCKGKVIYAHEYCCEMQDYDYENLVFIHKPSKFRWGVEFETNDSTDYETRLKLNSWYGLVCTSDCTVEEEFKSPIINGLYGARKYLDGINELVDIENGDNCGTHANVSLADWDNIDFERILRYWKIPIFRPLANYMNSLPYDTMKEVFGRGFGDYHEYADDGFYHGDWLQIKPYCLEFRLSRFTSTKQYFELLCMYKEMCEAIDKGYLKKYIPDNRETNRKNAVKVGEKLVKILQKHIDGKATYQKR